MRKLFKIQEVGKWEGEAGEEAEKLVGGVGIDGWEKAVCTCAC